MTPVGGCKIVVKGRKLVEILDSMNQPLDEARSTALFEQMMARRAEQEDKRANLWVVARSLGAACAFVAAAGAGAFRAFAPPERRATLPAPAPERPLKVVETTRRQLLPGVSPRSDRT